ncbi:3-dehydroquinate synthase, putative, partial [Perkinsus marinus ATCC 50983]
MCARPELFAELESLLSSKGVEGLVQDYDEFRHVIVAGIDYKRSVVEEDERDKGLRNELNWGHTVGHAIEGMGVTGLHHGECVSIGMVYEAMALRAQGQLSNIAAQRLEKVLKCCDLPTVLPPGAEENREELMRRMKRDKKNRGGAIHVVDVRDIGRCEGDSRTVPVPDRILKRVLSSAVTISGSALVKSGQKLGPSGGGVLELPGSKSISNRALVLAALAEKPGGKCR